MTCRGLAYVQKTWKESWRHGRLLLATLLLAPLLLLVLVGLYEDKQGTLQVAIINEDAALQTGAFISYIQSAVPRAAFIAVDHLEGALKLAEAGRIDAVLVLPAGTAKAMETMSQQAKPGNTTLTLYSGQHEAASLYLAARLGQSGHSPRLEIIQAGEGGPRALFYTAVPGIAALSLLNMVFITSAALMKEATPNRMRRLWFTGLGTGEYIGAITVVHLMFCLLSLLITLLVAVGLGLKITGSLLAIAWIGLCASLGVMGLAMITASLLKSMYDLLGIGIVPYALVFALSGIWWTLPTLELVRSGNTVLLLNHLLPLSLAVTAFHKVLLGGATLSQIRFEWIGTLLVSFVYFWLGLLLYSRKHLRFNR